VYGFVYGFVYEFVYGFVYEFGMVILVVKSLLIVLNALVYTRFYNQSILFHN